MASTGISGHWRRRWERRERGILLGSHAAKDRRAYLGIDRLFTHLHVIGPPGVGKTRVLLNIWQQLTDLDACVILLNPKGSLASMARDWAVANGLTGRLTYFDPGDPTHVVGYNPLRRNESIPLHTQVKAVREALRSAWGQSDFSQTPQLARVLQWALAAALELRLTLVEALDMIRPHSPLRERYLAEADDPYIRDALAYFDSLRASRQDELAASSLARLEAFVLDPTVRRIFAQQERSLDLGQIIRDRGLFVVNLEQYKPLRSDDVRLIGRLLINDLMTQVFSRSPQERKRPVFLLCDEVQTFITEDLATSLDQGRELGLCCILAHQHMGQFAVDETARRLAPSVENCARTKIVFGGLSVAEMHGLVDRLFLDRLDPWIVKDEITGLEIEPVEEVRASYSYAVGTTTTRGTSTSESGSTTVGRSQSESHTTGRAKGRGTSTSHGTTRTKGTSQTAGRGTSSSEGYSDGDARASIPTVHREDDTVVALSHTIATNSSGYVESEGRSEFSSASANASSATADSLSESETDTWSVADTDESGTSLARSDGWSHGETESSGECRTKSVTYSPFTAYRTRERVVSRQFLPIEEQRLVWMQKLAGQPQGHFVLKCPDRPAAFLRAARVPDPVVSARLLARARERFVALPHVAPIDVVDREDRERRAALLARPAGRKPPCSSDDESF